MHYGGARFGQLHFNINKQRDFVRGHGAQCQVTPALTCPCVTVEVQFDPLCPVCRGTGNFPQDDLAFQTTLLLTQYVAKNDYHEPGSWVEGAIQATILPGIQLAQGTFVRVLDMHVPFTDEVLVRGKLDSVRFQGAVQVSRVCDRDRLYEVGTEYTFTPPATITWLIGEGPPLGAPYSISYTAQPEYLVFIVDPRARVEFRRNYAQVVQLVRLDRLQRDGLLAPAPQGEALS
jgi:hypothetical protein